MATKRLVAQASIGLMCLALAGCASVGQEAAPASQRPASGSSSPPSQSVASIVGLVGLSGTAAWDVTAAGLAVSSDAGAHWSAVPLPTGVAPGDIAAAAHVAAGQIWVASRAGRAIDVSSSQSPGGPWTTAVLTPVWPAISGVNAPADKVFLTPGPAGVVTVAATVQVGLMSGFADMFVSADGGTTFKEHPATSGSQANDIWWSDAFVDQNHGVVVVGPTRAQILYTNDGGSSWTASSVVGEPAGSRYGLGDPSVVGSAIELPVTSMAADGSEMFQVFVSDDDGATFHTMGSAVDMGPTYDPPATVGISGPDIWVLEPGTGVLHESVDAGGSWTTTSSTGLPPNVAALDVTGPSGATAVIVDSRCAAAKSECTTSKYLPATRDGGMTWSTR